MNLYVKISNKAGRTKRFFIRQLTSYLPDDKNILEYGRRWGGDALTGLYDKKRKNEEHQAENVRRREFLKLIEQAKCEWQFSLSLLSEATDPDLIDYATYLAKSNEARYRYLIKLARAEKIVCTTWLQ